jgi:hypothetical protein
LDILKEELLKNENDIYMIANSELDSYTHNNGIDSDEKYVKKINEIDNTVEELSNSFLKSNPEGKLFLFSPHGMLNVNNRVNVEKYIKNQINVSENSFFIDSTAFRIWGSNLNEIWNNLCEIDKLILNGKFIWSSDLYSNEKIPKHIIWFANVGTICFPDFFRRTLPPKGMHGYIDLRVQDGFMITNGNLNQDDYYIKDIGQIINSNLT